MGVVMADAKTDGEKAATEEKTNEEMVV